MINRPVRISRGHGVRRGFGDSGGSEGVGSSLTFSKMDARDKEKDSTPDYNCAGSGRRLTQKPGGQRGTVQKLEHPERIKQCTL